jgi:pyruvate dehydrogenase E1 component alpha subunit
LSTIKIQLSHTEICAEKLKISLGAPVAPVKCPVASLSKRLAGFMPLPSNISDDEALALYKSMLTIRTVENRLSKDFKAGKLPGPVHLYIGQEAVASAVCMRLRTDDWITSTHRGHGHFIAKGGELGPLFDEIYGRVSGICGGKGGSMHVADVSKGILGANGIVGGGIALAAGAALAAQQQKTGAVAASFFGDGAANQGVLAEALNVAALWKLPIIFVCENNGFSEFSHSRDVTSGRIFERAQAFRVPTEEVDGNDALAVWNAAGRAVERARAGEGPAFIEAKTYRLHGHTENESNILPKAYRAQAEIDEWRAKDPVERLLSTLVESGRFPADALRVIESQISEAVDKAAFGAEQAPWPEPRQAFENMYA